MKNNNNQYKKDILKELKRDEWKQSVPEDEYEEKIKVFTKAEKRSLKQIKKQNRAFQHKQITTKPIKTLQIPDCIPEHARKAYEKVKETNEQSRKPCPEVPVEKLMYLLHYLNSGAAKNAYKSELTDCIKKQSSNFTVFWNCPSFILKSLRQCVLTRDWGKMVRFLLILLNYDKKYLHVAKNMCRVMLKANPMIKECGLEDQFKILTEPVQSEMTIV